LTTLVTRRGFAPTGRINVAGVYIERFDLAQEKVQN